MNADYFEVPPVAMTQSFKTNTFDGDFSKALQPSAHFHKYYAPHPGPMALVIRGVSMRKLFAPDPRRIGRPRCDSASDAVPASLIGGTPWKLRKDLLALLGPQKVMHRMTDLVRYASDASPYRYIPQAVVLPATVEDPAAILGYCRREKRHARFRSGGTILNGQSQSSDILVEIRRHWSGCNVEAEGHMLRARTGNIFGRANAHLAPYRRRLGPDPACGDACTIGARGAANWTGKTV